MVNLTLIETKMEKEPKNFEEESKEKPEEDKPDFSKINWDFLKKTHTWQIATAVLVVLFIVSLFNPFSSGVSGSTVRSTIEELSGASVLSVEEESGLYKVEVQDEDGNGGLIYMSKDGELLFSGAINVQALREYMQDMESATDSTIQESPTYSKTDKPKIELFVMSYCPFGIQAQQFMLPVMKLLKDKADIEVKFVSYIMHEKKEIDENTNQYCIQKEQSDKYIDYLQCFFGSQDSTTCLQTAGVDSAKLNTCIQETNTEFKIMEMYDDRSTWSNGQFPQYNVHKEENIKYQVRGSPTIIINGVLYSGARNSEAYKQAICSAFTTPPEECSQALSTASTGTQGSC